jgi:GTP cyclohydrolase I
MGERFDGCAFCVQPELGGPSAEHAVRDLLVALGEDPTREGLLDTPRRVVAMLKEMLTPVPFNFTTFENEGHINEMIVQSAIPFYSLCAHHIVPFMGLAYVAYIPNDRIVGLSKLARTVGHCAKGLQTQEQITSGVADMLSEHLHPLGVGVVLRARHLCVEMRGVKAHDTWTTTSCLRGAFLTSPEVRAEFMTLARGTS